MSYKETYALVELRRPVRNNRNFTDVEVEHIGPLCRIESVGLSFPLEAVSEFVHVQKAPEKKPVPVEARPKASPKRASPTKAKKKPAKPKSAVRTPKKVRRKSE